jgi:hypothetical protein
MIEDEVAGMGSEEKTDLLLFRSLATSKVVLEIGTANTDDYYPSCVLHFDPTALSHNHDVIDLLGREEATNVRKQS